ncbi:alpha/beta hydrolase [Brevibacterium sp. 50QC2O2]|uniref:alpha/beta fold hydrolase n=1 Tax=Brevibacterium TaxID=1696 RepID=UPI00211C47FA|nr:MULTISPECIES: alpha/beta hydrolase [unclassified Brevibacterium]MCQ9385993.1 alpha/beta hydrolase [Brevibacterium sp. 68QC2CO]MCQ9387716.1 alpha/beta hydrolase [Brevibacterium sp. 50QC2O2]
MSRDRNFPGPDTGYTSTFGTGDPVTLFAHGFSGSIRDTRPFSLGMAGTRALVNLGGHGGRPSPGPDWTYRTIAAQLSAALHTTGATRALGVSMSAGGLARLVTEGDPAACGLEKIAFVLPASWDHFTRELAARTARYSELLRTYLDTGDREGLTTALLAREPEQVRRLEPAHAWTRAKVDAIFDTDMRDGIDLARRIAVDHPEAAAGFPGEVLVLTHEEDPSHPVEIAQQYAQAFGARLEVLPPGSILWLGRSRVREILIDFFND